MIELARETIHPSNMEGNLADLLVKCSREPGNNEIILNIIEHYMF